MIAGIVLTFFTVTIDGKTIDRIADNGGFAIPKDADRDPTFRRLRQAYFREMIVDHCGGVHNTQSNNGQRYILWRRASGDAYRTLKG